ncbi:hypothetical protein [Xinfangfangia pollutisoli]|nr:hypothetical protein [Xinfangfangia pollutisoli]
MEEWLRIPDRRRRVSSWRSCVLMGLGFLTLWAGAPVLFGTLP